MKDSIWYCDIDSPLDIQSVADLDWDDSADVVVVGSGGAGICAALEAVAAGASALVIDRFEGGGATAQSGGIVYLGGGTAYQQSNGIGDDSEQMFRYLQQETQGVVSDATLRQFCDGSLDMLDWLEQRGVEFNAALSPVKTSYPTERYFLYYSGNEPVPAYAKKAQPAARGHRAFGRGLSGAAFYRPLHHAALLQGVRLLTQTRVHRLIRDAAGRIVGVESKTFGAAKAARQHRLYNSWVKRLRQYLPFAADWCRRQMQRLERMHAQKTLRVRARSGVVLATGGFVMNRAMVEHYAPKYRNAMPLGDTGCDGSGIALGQSSGGALKHMERVSAWRFINPPMAWAQGIVVNNRGQRYCNEQVYGAKLGHHMAEENQGRAWLIVDHVLFREAVKQALPWKIWLFQSAPALMNLFLNARRADNIEALAHKCGIPEQALAATVTAYNRAAAGEIEDSQGKASEFLRGLHHGPYYAMDISLDSKLFPCPTITLGGLLVDEASGAVLNDAGEPVSGLFAAGRCAVGVASNFYVSGLSLADCVFSGRRAGRAACG